MRARLGLLALLVLLALPATAGAHGGATTAVDYRSTVTGEPQGVSARVVGGDDRLAITRDGAAEVIVLGYDGEPYLRLDAEGVWENQRSPAVALNAERQEGTPSADADPRAEPRWERLSGGDTVLFHDHRAHWMGSQPPAAVREEPDAKRRLADWSVPVVVDGTPGSVTGFYTYEPPPSKALWLGGLAALAVVAGVAAWLLKGGRRRALLWVLAAVAVLPAPILGAAETLDLPDPTVDVVTGLAVYAVLLGALGVAAWWARRDRAAEAAILAVGALAIGAFALAGRLALLDHGVVPSELPGWLARTLLVVGLAATVGVAAGAVATWRETLAGAPAKGGRPRKERRPAEESF
jgi:hypothetical protein